MVRSGTCPNATAPPMSDSTESLQPAQRDPRPSAGASWDRPCDWDWRAPRDMSLLVSWWSLRPSVASGASGRWGVRAVLVLVLVLCVVDCGSGDCCRYAQARPRSNKARKREGGPRLLAVYVCKSASSTV